ncbi:MAG: helix-turn-helix domain-containing protein [Clostridiales bacterium]|nr:helix-turn-helix domain-containing protein [Clostridiales bacterium]
MGRKKSDISTMDVAGKMNQPLARRLNELITDTGELAAVLGCSIQAVNQYRTGISRPSLENVCKIADYYNVTTDYLLGRSDFKHRDTEQAAAAELGISEFSVAILRRQAHIDKSAARVIDLLAADMEYSVDGNRSLIDLINFFMEFEYGGGDQAISPTGKVFTPEKKFTPSRSIRLDQHLVEEAVLVELNAALRGLKEVQGAAQKQGQTLQEYFDGEAGQHGRR